MVNALTWKSCNIKWLMPSPLWRHAGEQAPPRPRRPAILGFTSDSFMDDFLDLMEQNPDSLGEWIAKPETWRTPAPKPRSAFLLKGAQPPDLAIEPSEGKEQTTAPEPNTTRPSEGGEELPLKLYQPAHQRYYLVTASLVCRQAGLPDRTIDPGKEETASFVIRRLVDPEGTELSPIGPAEDASEHAFVMTAQGPAWRKLEQHEIKTALPDEERLPLSAVGFAEAGGYRRRLWVGLVPVARREVYLTTSRIDPGGGDATAAPDAGSGLVPDPHKVLLFRSGVAEPWKILLEQAAATKDTLNLTGITDLQSGFGELIPNDHDRNAKIRCEKQNILKTAREQIQTVSWYILLDFAEFLRDHMSAVWGVVTDEVTTEQQKEASLGSDDERDLYRILTQTNASNLQSKVGDVEPSLRDALRQVLSDEGGGTKSNKAKLETVTSQYDRSDSDVIAEWPDFLFPFADPDVNVGQNPFPPVTEGAPAPVDLEDSQTRIDALTDLVAKIMPKLRSDAVDEPLLTERNYIDTRDGWFYIRCVYERPHCWPFAPPEVSEPTEAFQLAAFFDPDAPARPIRIPMPVDISPAGLRKYKKNTAFIVSDMLCGQIKRIRRLTLGDLVLSVLPWPFHKDLPFPGEAGPCGAPSNNFGMICSLSIPIVTLCALILLMIMVTLFDIFFRWLPYLFMCFPIPGLKGKKP